MTRRISLSTISIIPLKSVLISTLMIFSNGCDQGPDYEKPTLELPLAFKHQNTDWKKATIQSSIQPDSWWQIFDDPTLNQLERELQQSNYSIKAAEYAYKASISLVKQKSASYYPTLSATSSVSRQQTSSSSTQTSASSKPSNIYNMGLSASWEIDLFDRIGKSVDVAVASAEAERANLDAIRLAQQALLAQYYFQLKITDLKEAALSNQKSDYEELLKITSNKYDSGIVGQQDILQAQQQLETLKAQYDDNTLSRAQLENAMATLLGKAPSAFNQSKTSRTPQLPHLPFQIPSALLERRPDIRQAERLVAEANAQIGLEYTAYFPSLTLSGEGGFQSRQFFDWFTIPSRFWSLGPTLAYTLFDGGARDAAIEGATFSYEQTVSNYKNTVLTAFQEVENYLAELRYLKSELELQQQAALHARQALTIITNQYKAGINSYSDVLIAQTAASSSELQSLDTLSRLLVAAVNYVKAIGGSWTTKD